MKKAKESAACVPKRQLRTGNGDGRREFFRKVGGRYMNQIQRQDAAFEPGRAKATPLQRPDGEVNSPLHERQPEGRRYINHNSRQCGLKDGGTMYRAATWLCGCRFGLGSW